MAEKLPFTFTPNIVRYLKEIIEVYEKHAQGVPKDIPIPSLVHIVDTYLPDETFYSFSEQNRLAFARYLGRNGAVDIADNDEGNNDLLMDRADYWPDENDESPDLSKAFGTHPWEIRIVVRDVKPVIAVWNQYLRQKSTDKLDRNSVQEEEMAYNQERGRLTFRGESIRFHQGKGTQKPSRLLLFETLWEHHRHVVRGNTTRPGNPLTFKQVENYLGKPVSKSAWKNLESYLQAKDMKVRIDDKDNTLLLVVEED